MNELDELRAELSEFAAPKTEDGFVAHQERVIAAFREIQAFVDENGRSPEHGEDRDMFERMYAARLDRIRELEECKDILAPYDYQGLIGNSAPTQAKAAEAMEDDELLAELEGITGAEITELRHVRSRAEIRAAEEIANRERCEDFERFEPLIRQAETDLRSGARQTIAFGRDASVAAGNLFILGGQLVYVAEIGDGFRTPNGELDARMRVIYSNGTESNLLLRSLQRALYKDEAGRRVSDPDAGPLFSGTKEEGDIGSGTIYVLRSLSPHPFVVEHRNLIHKIGVTGGKIEARIAGAQFDPTYLLADVEIVASYHLVGINRSKMERLFHRIFSAAQIDLVIQDRFGHPVRPREWFLVPLHLIDEAVTRIQDGSISSVVYDPKTARLEQRGE